MTDNTPRRRMRGTGPSRPGTGGRAGRWQSSTGAGRRAVTRHPDESSVTATGSADDPRPTGDPADEVAVDGPAVPSGPTRARSGFRSGRSSTSRAAGTRPGTAPPAAATAGGRRIGRIAAGGTPAARPARAKSTLVKQVAVLGLVCCAVALALAVPLRNYLAQRTELANAVHQDEQLHAQLSAEQQRKAALSDPAYIAAQARRRLQYVKPGDTVFVVHAPAVPAPAVARSATVVPTAPWYSNLWATLSDPAAKTTPR